MVKVKQMGLPNRGLSASKLWAILFIKRSSNTRDMKTAFFGKKTISLRIHLSLSKTGKKLLTLNWYKSYATVSYRHFSHIENTWKSPMAQTRLAIGWPVRLVSKLNYLSQARVTQGRHMRLTRELKSEFKPPKMAFTCHDPVTNGIQDLPPCYFPFS